MQTVIAEIKNPSMTTEQAADHFCRTHWDRPRARTELTPDGRFSLVDGMNQYRVSMDGSGYLVWRI